MMKKMIMYYRVKAFPLQSCSTAQKQSSYTANCERHYV